MTKVYVYECTYCIWSETHTRRDLELKCPVCGAEMVLAGEKDE